MPTSKKKKSLSGILTIIVIVILLVAGNGALNYVLTPYSGSSQEMWRYYKETSPEMIYTGSSQCLCGIDPETIDGMLHTTSYNMGTNMQSFRSSYVAIRAAVEEKGVKRVVLCVDDEIIGLKRADNFRADASFQRARNQHTGMIKRVKETGAFLLEEPVLMHVGSINFFFPWTYDRVNQIGLNLREKRGGQIYETEGHRMTTGREPSKQILEDFQAIDRTTVAQWNISVTDLEILSLSEDSGRELQKIAAYCQEKGVELIPIAMPYPSALRLYSLDSYKATVAELTELFAAYGFDYHNFNFAKPDFYEQNLTEYKDTGHFNNQGAIRFSQVLASYLEMTEKQRDQVFYGVDEF